jgi:NADPH-dependent 2,4-dienoyl-CoA reductase/sulfur reductase-like enzyme
MEKDPKPGLVVVGGVAAGMSAAAKARRMQPEMPITVFERDGYVSYGACGLPYYVSGDVRSVDDLIHFTPEQFKRQRDIDVHVHHEVTSIDPSAQTVTVSGPSGREREVTYSSLMLATGASPIHLPGQERFSNVYTIDTIEHGLALEKECGHISSVAIIGGGFISMEMAEAFRKRGIFVRIFQRSSHIMKSFDFDMSTLIEHELSRHGVELYKDIGEVELEGGDRVTHVSTDMGRYEVDAVLIAIGVRPNVELARQAGVKLGTTGAIKTDDHMRTSVPNIYAGGDNTQGYSPVTGSPCYFPLGDTANKMGKVAGENIAGGDATYGGCLGSAIVKIFDLTCARTGLNTYHAGVIGIDILASTSHHYDRASYCPQRNEITTKLLTDIDGKIVGGQMIGTGGVSGRIDVIATAIYNRMRPHDLYKVDFCYSPPFSPVWDPLLIAARVAMDKAHAPQEKREKPERDVLTF